MVNPITLIADGLVQLLLFFHGLTGSYGIAIVLLTLVIKLVMHPLTRKSFKAMKAMQALAPQMTVLRERHKSDPRTMNAEMMNLYRTNRVNPFSGCLPQLVQLPVLYGLFAALRRPGLFGGETFLGAGLEQVPSFGAIAAHPLLAIYPLLVGATTYLQQMISITDPQQARMFVFMPIMVAYFATNFQIGLSIYWIVSTLAYMVEYLLVVGRLRPAPAGTVPAPNPNPPQVLSQRPKGTKKK